MVQDTYRSYLGSGALAAIALNRLLDEFLPDTLVMFNGRMSSTRVALELALSRGIRVYCHERGDLTETLQFYENEGCDGSETRARALASWCDTPLTQAELERAIAELENRRRGQNMGWRPFNVSESGCQETLQELNLTSENRIWAVFTSSGDESAASEKSNRIFHNQFAWVEALVGFITEHPEIHLVIRVHPNSGGGAGALGKNQGETDYFAELKERLPPNAQIKLSHEVFNSYALMDVAETVFTYGTTLGLEAACQGKKVVVSSVCEYFGKNFVDSVHHASEFHTLLANLANSGRLAPDVEVARHALRHYYTAQIRMSIPFPLVKMPNPHVGVLNYHSMEDIRPGAEPNLDHIADCILEGKSLVPVPLADDPLRTVADEIKCIEEWLRGASISNDRDEKPTVESPAGQHLSEQPRVAIVIPSFNAAKYLPDTLDSIIRQTYQSWECIIVDDGSSDYTGDMVALLQAVHPDKPIRYLHKENGGPADARNAGIAATNAEWILPLDADDRLGPTYLEETIALALEAPQADIVRTHLRSFGDILTQSAPGEFTTVNLLQGCIQAYASLFRRSLWEKVGGYPVAIPIGTEDWCFWLAASLQKPVVKTVAKPLFLYRMMQGQGLFQNNVIPNNDFARAAMLTLHERDLDIEFCLAGHQVLRTMSEDYRAAIVKVTQRFPNEPQPYLWLGLFAEEKSSFDEAFNLYETCEKASAGTLWQVAWVLYQFFMKQNKSTEAAHWLTQACKRSSSIRDKVLRESEENFSAGRKVLAEFLIDALLGAAPEHPQALNNKAVMQFEQGQFSISLMLLEAARTQEPENQEFLQNISAVQEALALGNNKH